MSVASVTVEGNNKKKQTVNVNEQLTVSRRCEVGEGSVLNYTENQLLYIEKAYKFLREYFINVPPVEVESESPRYFNNQAEMFDYWIKLPNEKFFSRLGKLEDFFQLYFKIKKYQLSDLWDTIEQRMKKAELPKQLAFRILFHLICTGDKEEILLTLCDLLKQLGQTKSKEDKDLWAFYYFLCNQYLVRLLECVEVQYVEKFAMFHTDKAPFLAYLLGQQHERGMGGVKQNDTAAAQYYRIAIEGEFFPAYNALGELLYRTGSPKSGMIHIIKAAKCHYPPALYNLYFYYTNSLRKDIDFGNKCLLRAMGWRYPRALSAYWMHSNEGVTFGKNLSSPLVYLKMAAKLKDGIALYNLGILRLSNNRYVEVNFKKAFKLFEAAAMRDVEPAFFALGYCYEHGIGVEQDLENAFYYYSQGGERGDYKAICSVGVFLHYGIAGIQKDVKTAVLLYKNAADAGVMPAIYYLGNCLIYGDGVPQNIPLGLYMVAYAFKRHFLKVSSMGDLAAVNINLYLSRVIFYQKNLGKVNMLPPEGFALKNWIPEYCTKRLVKIGEAPIVELAKYFGYAKENININQSFVQAYHRLALDLGIDFWKKYEAFCRLYLTEGLFLCLKLHFPSAEKYFESCPKEMPSFSNEGEYDTFLSSVSAYIAKTLVWIMA